MCAGVDEQRGDGRELRCSQMQPIFGPAVAESPGSLMSFHSVLISLISRLLTDYERKANLRWVLMGIHGEIRDLFPNYSYREISHRILPGRIGKSNNLLCWSTSLLGFSYLGYFFLALGHRNQKPWCNLTAHFGRKDKDKSLRCRHTNLLDHFNLSK